jgi:hypothetical protein
VDKLRKPTLPFFACAAPFFAAAVAGFFEMQAAGFFALLFALRDACERDI